MWLISLPVFSLLALLCSSSAFAACVAEFALPDEKITQRLTQLRSQKGHFEGGQWQAALDRWQGEKHCLLQAGAALALRQQATPDQVQKLLGVADLASKSGPQALPDQCASRLHSKDWLWYGWRGTHDSMLLEFSQNKLHNIIWCLSHE